MNKITVTTSRRLRGGLRATMIAGGLAALLIGASGCSAGTGASSAPKTTIWGISGDGQQWLFGDPVNAWNKAHPTEKIAVTYFANDPYHVKIRTAVGANAGPTIIFNWAGGALRSYVNAHKVADLTEAAAGLKGKILPSVLGQGVVNGKIYALPMNSVQPVVLYYNKAVLSQAGIDVPKTWDDILASIPKLKKIGVAPFSLAGASKWTNLMWEEYLVDRVGGPGAFNAVMDGKKGAWSNPAFVKANTMIQQLVNAGAFIDGFASVSADNSADTALIYTGKAAMLLQGQWVYGTFDSQDAQFTKTNLGYTTFPTLAGGKGDPTNVVGNTSNYFSVSSTATPEEQKIAIAYLTSTLWNKTYTKTMLAQQGIPPLTGIGPQVATLKDSDFSTLIYNMTAKAKNFQYSWDEALPPAQATELLKNLDELFTKRITPQQFSDNMNKSIGE